MAIRKAQNERVTDACAIDDAFPAIAGLPILGHATTVDDGERGSPPNCDARVARKRVRTRLGHSVFAVKHLCVFVGTRQKRIAFETSGRVPKLKNGTHRDRGGFAGVIELTLEGTGVTGVASFLAISPKAGKGDLMV